MMNPLHLITDPWYKKGLKFKCTECGKCCSGFPGFVWLSPSDIGRLAKRLNVSKEAFIKRYTRRKEGKLSLVEKKNYDCIFYQNKKCTVYEARPSQCRTFPFWLSNIKSERDWKNAKESCEGIDHPEGKVISSHEIQHNLKKYLENSELCEPSSF